MSIFTILLVAAVVVLRSANTFILHTAGEKVAYSSSVAILMSELIKQLICSSIAIFEEYRSNKSNSFSEYISIPNTVNENEEHSSTTGSRRSSQEMKEHFDQNEDLPQPYGIKDNKTSFERLFKAFQTVKQKTLTKKAFLLSIPAGLYVVQNNLIFFAIPRMEPSVYQAAWQIRLLPTAYLASQILKRHISFKRWICLLGVVQGVIILESPELFGIKNGSDSSSSKHNNLIGNEFIPGTIALLIASFLSAFAAVLLEKIYVSKETNLWIASFQLSFFSILPASFLVFVECFHSNSFFSPFQSLFHSVWPWYAILAQSFVGVLVGLMTKFAGSVGNGLAGTGSIALISFVTLLFPDQDKKMSMIGTSIMIFGIALTIFCTHLYSSYGAKEAKANYQEIQGEDTNHQSSRNIS